MAKKKPNAVCRYFDLLIAIKDGKPISPVYFGENWFMRFDYDEKGGYYMSDNGAFLTDYILEKVMLEPNIGYYQSDK